jgi:hypothetical protein
MNTTLTGEPFNERDNPAGAQIHATSAYIFAAFIGLINALFFSVEPTSWFGIVYQVLVAAYLAFLSPSRWRNALIALAIALYSYPLFLTGKFIATCSDQGCIATPFLFIGSFISTHLFFAPFIVSFLASFGLKRLFERQPNQGSTGQSGKARPRILVYAIAALTILILGIGIYFYPQLLRQAGQAMTEKYVSGLFESPSKTFSTTVQYIQPAYETLKKHFPSVQPGYAGTIFKQTCPVLATKEDPCRIVSHETREVQFEIVSLQREFLEPAQVQQEMDRRGLRPAIYEELIAFGIAYPEELKNHFIIALGSRGYNYSDEAYPEIGNDPETGDAGLFFKNIDYGSGHGDFLAVPKEKASGVNPSDMPTPPVVHEPEYKFSPLESSTSTWTVFVEYTQPADKDLAFFVADRRFNLNYYEQFNNSSPGSAFINGLLPKQSCIFPDGSDPCRSVPQNPRMLTFECVRPLEYFRVTPEDILIEMARRHLRPATYREALAFARAHPEEITKKEPHYITSMYIVGSFATIDNRVEFLEIKQRSDSGDLYLTTWGYDAWWTPSCFPGVRE